MLAQPVTIIRRTIARGILVLPIDKSPERQSDLLIGKN